MEPFEVSPLPPFEPITVSCPLRIFLESALTREHYLICSLLKKTVKEKEQTGALLPSIGAVCKIELLILNNDLKVIHGLRNLYLSHTEQSLVAVYVFTSVC